ncbi:hypothetical protein HU200_036617 [Digitaria exilis]|uniref:Uncharacterized protein n=1 Tax=Digitaria exilis TaxID=1010633 RepID=A0A835BGW2_9POAL|nr:hypothetical protein HU200_036617 [Digitaria exilis]
MATRALLLLRETPPCTLAALAAAVALVWLAAWTLEWAWWSPRRLERALRAQGLKGTRYRLFTGDLPENARLMTKPLPLGCHDIIPRVLPMHDKVSMVVSKTWLPQAAPAAAASRTCSANNVGPAAALSEDKVLHIWLRLLRVGLGLQPMLLSVRPHPPPPASCTATIATTCTTAAATTYRRRPRGCQTHPPPPSTSTSAATAASRFLHSCHRHHQHIRLRHHLQAAATYTFVVATTCRRRLPTHPPLPRED